MRGKGPSAVGKDAALDGLRVLEFTQGLAGSLCGRFLAELGGEVIKIEPPQGDPLRTVLDVPTGRLDYAFESLAAGKKGMALDLTRNKARTVLKELIQASDILIQDSLEDPLEPLGMGYSSLSRVHPRLIFCSITPFGRTGPLRSKTANEMVVQAMSGVLSTTGLPHHPPTRAGVEVGAFVSSVYATIGILAALEYREESNRGQAVDISMQDCLLSFFPTFLPTLFLTGEVPPRRGNRHTMCSPWNAYPAWDGWVIICTANDEEWRRLLDIMGRPELKGAPHLRGIEDRVRNEEEVDALVADWTRERPVEEIVRALEGAKVASAPILTIDQLLTDPHFLFRRMVTEVIRPYGERIPVVGSLFKLSETPGRIGDAAPRLGEHSEEILAGILHYPLKRIQELKGEGVI